MKKQSSLCCLLLTALCLQLLLPPRRSSQRRSPDRVSIAAIQLVSPPVPRQFGWLCASLAT